MTETNLKDRRIPRGGALVGGRNKDYCHNRVLGRGTVGWEDRKEQPGETKVRRPRRHYGRTTSLNMTLYSTGLTPHVDPPRRVETPLLQG